MAPRPANRPPTILWALFGFDGRIGREVFWLGNFFCGFLTIGLTVRFDEATGVPVLSPLSSFFLIPLLWTELALAVKRLHDRGLTGWLAALLGIPFVGLAAFFVIGFLPGEKGPNAYGPGTNLRAV